MITLNLISPVQKKELKLIRAFLILKNVIIYLLLFLILTAIILLFSKLILQNNFNRVIAEFNLNNQTGTIFTQDIKQFNQKIKVIESVQNSYISWSEPIVYWLNLMPKNVVLNSLIINKEKQIIQISGRALNRAALLEMEQALMQAECIQNLCMEEIDIPISQKILKENIDFQVSAKLII
ncbi:hypothetical protein KKA15_00755 [Patescibacteria group bacterium]|nr:hypothetical protein [Patescibacteria group bacterium]